MERPYMAYQHCWFNCIRSIAHLLRKIGQALIFFCRRVRTMERRANSSVVAANPEHTTLSAMPKVCMHVLGIGSTDARVQREANALARVGYEVSIVDIEEKRT